MVNSSVSADRPKSVSILGSTGSVGDSTIDLIERDRGAYRVVALTAHGNWAKLAKQALALRPAMVALSDPAGYTDLKSALAGSKIAVAAGPEAPCEAAALASDWVMAAIVGAAGLRPTLAAVDRGAVICLANKECLVCAGDLFMAAVRSHKATLLPVDSEHNAIFQVFDFEQKDKIRKIILTASGGPFRTWPLRDMSKVTPAQAVRHPNWSMGAKISVDSATMMNKGLEVIEAHHLFGLESDRIDILVHPQSVVHSMVEYVDGSTLAQLGTPDMRTPIAYALGWPKRMPAPTAGRLDLAKLGSLTFETPDPVRFPALRLARAALQSGGAAPTILNAANEVAVARFLAGDIGFLDIAAIVEHTMTRVPLRSLQTLDAIMAIDDEARRVAAAAKRLIAAE
ncbi:MAG: 1-deoxy-D-xylulose-5-phosphate reductoisomerase [Rhodospirillaceae bacterium]|nr:1-deoxy-D-xylulose-5-phosphate reductoisomerase [Rhodospirillaceae bacterium]